MFTPNLGPAFPILDKWNTWARENHRPDICKAIWRIYDLLEGRYFDDESKLMVSAFLAERADSPDLQVVKKEIEKAMNPPVELLPPGCAKCGNRDMKPQCPVTCEFNQLEIF